MENKITIMAVRGGINNAYKIFNMVNISLMQYKPVNIFFDAEAVKFLVKPQFYNLSNEENYDSISNNRINKSPLH